MTHWVGFETGNVCCSFPVEALESLWWQQMVERKKRLIENHFQHIPPLVVEQDPVASPVGLHVLLFPTTLITFQYNSSFPLRYLSFFTILLHFSGILLPFALALLKSSRASRENMLICFLTCFFLQEEPAALHEKLSAVGWYHHQHH